jgi:hypothetical protein
MKFNKWTVALAALGVVSFASAAKAEEKASPVMTALASTTISGYVDTSAQWNFGTGNANNPPYKFGGAGKADGFNLNVIQLRIDKPLDESDWAAGYRADLWFGPDANGFGNFGLGTTSAQASDDPSDFAIRQAYVVLRAPVGTGLDFKMGVFDSVVGYESIEAGNNPNFTRSYGHSIEPQTHTGLLASYRFCECFSASAGVANTVSSTINGRANPPTGGDKAESYKAYMGSIALTAPESMGFLSGSTLYAGVVNGFSPGNGTSATYGNRANYYVGATVATPVTGLRFGAAFDYLKVWDTATESWSVAGYASYQATEKLSFHARAEYLDDRVPVLGFPVTDEAGNVTFSMEKVLALTATVQYDLWKNVISRLELRWDHALRDVSTFGGNAEPNRENAWMLAANVIYKF